MNPKISVILPVYNAEKTIAESIQSILNQTYDDFELILINDGSTDNSEQIILTFQDKRINYYINEGNKGLIYTLNRGIELAHGEYIARMDADDRSLPQRFEKQVKILNDFSNIVVCGTQIKGFGIPGAESFKYISKERSADIKRYLIINSAIVHPSAMIRRKTLIDNHIRYKNYLHAEDYKLWTDLVEFGDFYNIPEILLEYRVSETQISQKYYSIQIETAKRCRREYIYKLLNDDKIKKDLAKREITIESLRRLKCINHYNEILEVFYMSLSSYSFKEFIYYVTSLDWRKFRLMTSLAILKRFVLGKNPVI